MSLATCLKQGLFIVGGRRTAFGAFGGKLKGHTATDLQEIAVQSCLTESKLDAKDVDSIIIGNVIQSSKDAPYVSRHVGLRCGMRQEIPALTINRLCGSGFQSIVNAIHEIVVDGKNVVMTGGTESMSQTPFVLRNSRFGMKLGSDGVLEDVLWQGLIDQHIKLPMGITAENLADKYGITRDDCEEFALRSQQNWAKGQAKGVFNSEIVPISLKGRKGVEEFSVDEHPMPKSDKANMAKLPSVFKKGGTVTAATASGICDGAAAVAVTSEGAVTSKKLRPLARILGYSYVGCDPTIMGIGPAPAIKNLLKACNKSLADIDFVEVNEAFAAQTLAVIKETGLNPETTNVNGGAIALGHPLAASGSRIMTHLTHLLHDQDKKLAIGSACIGGGQGIAMLIERC